MKVKFWGTRGSLPVSLSALDVRAKLIAALSGAKDVDLSSSFAIEQYVDSLRFEIGGTYGGNSSCVQVFTGSDEHIIFDVGSGVRQFGADVLEKHGVNTPQTYHIIMSHSHWDHIMGFPFFTPAYIPGNRIIIYGCHKNLDRVFQRQQEDPYFPVGFAMLGASVEFCLLPEDTTSEVAGVELTPLKMLHSGDSYAWRLEHQGRSLVYATDGEHKPEDVLDRERFAQFVEGADLVIFDAMYSLADTMSICEDWGHSSSLIGIELCHIANAKRLCLFHHDPDNNDAQLSSILEEARRYEQIVRNTSPNSTPLIIDIAWDGRELEV